MRHLAFLPAALLAASCSPVMHREFIVESLNTQESSLPGVVFLEDEPLAGEDGQVVRTPATIKVVFKKRADGSGYESLKVGVKAVKVDEAGKVIHGLRPGEASEYQADFRALYPEDAKRQLFILHRRRAGL